MCKKCFDCEKCKFCLGGSKLKQIMITTPQSSRVNNIFKRGDSKLNLTTTDHSVNTFTQEDEPDENQEYCKCDISDNFIV